MVLANRAMLRIVLAAVVIRGPIANPRAGAIGQVSYERRYSRRGRRMFVFVAAIMNPSMQSLP
jgi:hypothetical protein